MLSGAFERSSDTMMLTASVAAAEINTTLGRLDSAQR